jgi:hypothetical protein
LNAAARAAAIDGDDKAASGYDLDTLRLGSASGRGGMMIHWSVASAIQRIGLHGVHKRCRCMTPPMRRHWIGKLPALDADFESLDACLGRDDIWSSHAHGWQGRLIHVIQGQVFDRRLLAQRESRDHAYYRLLTIELALADYRDRNGKYPQTLADLVPGELETLPADPFTGKPLVYRSTDDGFRLYSVGPNGVDDGGQSCENDDNEGDDIGFR